MRIAVYGAGAVGGYFGGRLIQAGEEVVFIARGEHLHVMQRRGLLVESVKGDFSINPVNATSDLTQAGTVDVVLVCVKAWQVPEAALAIRPLLKEDTFVIPLQNGVDAPGQLALVLGKEHVVGGLCHIMSFIVEPGHIRHAAVEPHIAFGELDGHRSERTEKLKAAFDRAGVWAEVPENIHTALWEKLLFIASISGVGAITRAPVGVFRSLPETRSMLIQAMEEIVALAKAKKVPMASDAIERTLSFIDKLAPEATASMQRDITAGRPSELASQNGAIVRMGLEVGVSTPVHGFIYNSLLPQELRARGEIKYQ